MFYLLSLNVHNLRMCYLVVTYCLLNVYLCFPREAWDLDLVRETTTKPAPWKSLGRQFSGARRGGPVTQWALRAGISTHAAVSARFPGLEKASGGLWGHQGVYGDHFGVTLWVMNFTQVCRNWTKIPPLKSARRALARGDNEKLWNLHLIWVFDEKLKQM